MRRPLQLGVIGAGRVGQIAHLAHYARDPRIELALADIRPKLRALVAERFGIRRTFADHHALLAAGVDAVVVVVRRPATGPVVLDALRGGAHVLSEKPMALTARDAQRLVDAARAAQRLYGVAYMKRHDRGVAVLRDAVAAQLADGAWGKLEGVRAWSGGGADGSVPGDYLMTNEERPDGLSLWEPQPAWLEPAFAQAYEEHLNVHSHISNAVRYVLGDAFTLCSARRDDNRTTLHAQTGDGTPVHFALYDGRRSGPWYEGILLEFVRGRLQIDFQAPFASGCAAVVTQTTSTGVKTLDAMESDDAFARQARAFAAAVRDRRDFTADATDALHDVTFAEDVWRRLASAKTRV